MYFSYKILDKNKKLIEASSEEWRDFNSDFKNKIVEQTELKDEWVSTVFSGLDHGYEGKSLWFETMVFKMKEGEKTYNDIYCNRYETYEEAKAGHEDVLHKLKHGKLELYGDED